MIETKIVGHSVNPQGVEIISFLNTGPRFIHSEVMTHRGFSRNAASSRAIPIEKMISDVMIQPAMPERWGVRAEKGMQDGGVMNADDQVRCEESILMLRNHAVRTVDYLNGIKSSKQIANRYIEPWAHITVLITTTYKSLANFFGLRAHEAADPTFQVLAYRMLYAYLNSKPEELTWGEWHMPLLDRDSCDNFSTEERLKIATALALRTSYSKFDECLEHDRAFKMHDRAAEVGHWSAFEHCAQASVDGHLIEKGYRFSNFDIGGWSGWLQYRKTFPNECIELDRNQLETILDNAPDWITV